MKRRAFAFVIVIVLAGLAFVPAVAAGPPSDVEGNWEWSVGEFIEEKIAGGNMFFSGFEYGVWSGDLQGTSLDEFRGVFHPTGFATVQFRITFAGSVLGVEGTMVFEMATVGRPDGSAYGSWVIKSGTGGLAGLRGEGKFWIEPDDLLGSYSGKVHWKQ